jgi:hypothetical protein
MISKVLSRLYSEDERKNIEKSIFDLMKVRKEENKID